MGNKKLYKSKYKLNIRPKKTRFTASKCNVESSEPFVDKNAGISTIPGNLNQWQGVESWKNILKTSPSPPSTVYIYSIVFVDGFITIW